MWKASSLAGSAVVNSALGFVYWWLAAHHFQPAAIGRASAAISAMRLLGMIGTLGLGTLLIGELSCRPHERATLITTALLVVGAVASGLGLLFAWLAPLLSVELPSLTINAGTLLLFALGVALTAVALVLDQAVIGLLHGELQLWRNILFGAVKLGALLVAATWWVNGPWRTIYATWCIGLAASLFPLLVLALYKGRGQGALRPRWTLLHSLGRLALGHHALNVALEVTSLALPLVVTALLSAEFNAYFYTAAMLVAFVYVGPAALTTVLYAVGAADPAALAQRARFTLGLGALAGLLANAGLLVVGRPLLAVFGPAYAEQALRPLLIFGLGVFPVVISEHFVAIHRIEARAMRALPLVVLSAVLQLGLAAIGGKLAGLVGLSVGTITGAYLGALPMVPLVYRIARNGSHAAS